MSTKIIFKRQFTFNENLLIELVWLNLIIVSYIDFYAVPIKRPVLRKQSVINDKHTIHPSGIVFKNNVSLTIPKRAYTRFQNSKTWVGKRNALGQISLVDNGCLIALETCLIKDQHIELFTCITVSLFKVIKRQCEKINIL